VAAIASDRSARTLDAALRIGRARGRDDVGIRVERPRDHAPTLQHSAPRCNSVVGAHRQHDVRVLVRFCGGRVAPAARWDPVDEARADGFELIERTSAGRWAVGWARGADDRWPCFLEGRQAINWVPPCRPQTGTPSGTLQPRARGPWRVQASLPRLRATGPCRVHALRARIRALPAAGRAQLRRSEASLCQGAVCGRRVFASLRLRRLSELRVLPPHATPTHQ
jgi:hypothetical protein